ncbi:hypothetical protein HNY73_020563 [Argiope bruennichi]|uniref:Uncharacterized protein n=1 Tax=Argiope bruennichi TaxID=94029 RepID=A0A8T0E8B2_ARGBR|nr:hypothetical protein HNY73_020563 [Argiope bruennichi]
MSFTRNTSTCSNMQMYSIPECSTDDETFDEDYCEPIHFTTKTESKYVQRNHSCEDDHHYCEPIHFAIKNEIRPVPRNNSCPSAINKLDISVTALSYKTISLQSTEITESICNSEGDLKQLSSSAITFTESARKTDIGSSKCDNKFQYASSSTSDINVQRIPKPYLKNGDCDSSRDGTYEKLSLKPFNSITSSDPFLSVPSTEDKLISSFSCTKKDEVIEKLSSESNTTLSVTVDKYSERRRSAADITMPVPRGRSGSIQWIQNVIQNIDNRCRSLLDLRRPSDIAEEGIRNSKELLEADQSDEVSKVKQNSGASGRRYSENIIGKQKRFPFSSGIGHLKGLWKEKNENKKHEHKEIDEIRTDVCPLFNFPTKGDEDELILDALRQAMRKCTSPDPSARPTSISVLEQLSQIMK